MNEELLAFRAKNLNLADMIMVTFEYQKIIEETKQYICSKTEDNIVCLVKAWANTIKRILYTIPAASGDTKVCAYNDGGNITAIDSSYVRAKIREL